jgi:8-oxo-dGTP pyrophosphatase MutT (NUDIX family)
VARHDGGAHPPVAQRTPAPLGRHVLDKDAPRRGPAPLVRGAGVARLRQTTATSAGGIVIRFEGTGPQLVVGKRLRERDGVTWTLPKGTPHPAETTEETALREVEEESGLVVEIVRPFDSIAYTFVQGRTRIHKTVHYFLMVPTGGDLARHDHEFDEVRWVGFDEAAGLLTFETERALVARAAGAATDGTFPGADTPTGQAGA